MSAVFGLRVGFSRSRPLRPDEQHAFVTLLGEDSTRGRLEAERTAVAMVSGIHRASMVTSTELLHVEL